MSHVLFYVLIGVGAAVVTGVSLVFPRGPAMTETTRRVRAVPIARVPVVGRRQRLIGTARKAGEEIVTSRGRTACLAYRASVFMMGSGSNQRAIDADVNLMTSFRLEVEGTDAIAIPETGGVHVDGVDHIVWTSTAAPGFGDSILKREAAAGGMSAPSHHEAVITDGMRVAIVGTVERADDGTLRLVGTSEHPLLISCHPKALIA